MSQKELAGAFGGELAAFISSHLGVQGQGAGGIGLSVNDEERPLARRSRFNRRPATGYRVAAESMARCVHRRCQGTALTRPRCRRWRRAMLASNCAARMALVVAGEQPAQDLLA